MRTDPRLFQIASLGLLLVYGRAVLDFDVSAAHVGVVVGTALLAQYAGTRLAGLPRFDPLSALISALSLSLLLHTSDLGVAASAAALAIGSKFALRVRGKHVFNPTAFGIVATLAAAQGRAWTSPAQWGHTGTLVFLLVCLGSLTLSRVARSGTTVAFLAFHTAALVGRAAALGDPLAIPLHQLENGGLLLFAFFMISDPKTTPNSLRGRILFAGSVEAVAYYLQTEWFLPNALLYSLVACASLIPLFDAVLRAPRYHWDRGPFGDGPARATVPEPPLAQSTP